MSVRIPRVSSNYTVRQIRNSVVITQQAAGVGTAASYTFALADLDNATTFQTLFDQYRIDAIMVSIKPQNNAIGLFTTASITLSDLYVVLDYDNATNLTSSATAREYDNCMTLAPTESGMRVFQPRMAVAAYSGAFTSFANLQDQWIDSAYPNVIHYGVKAYLPGGAAGQTSLQVWELIFDYYVSFRSVI
jgi:hypothetical protein